MKKNNFLALRSSFLSECRLVYCHLIVWLIHLNVMLCGSFIQLQHYHFSASHMGLRVMSTEVDWAALELVT